MTQGRDPIVNTSHRDAVDGRNRPIAGKARIFDLIHARRL